MAKGRFSGGCWQVAVCCLSLFPAVVGAIDEPGELTGITSFSAGAMAEPNAPCPDWVVVQDRNGWDGGHLKIELDACQVIEYELFTRAQNAGPGFIADLEPDDLIIVWDEDAHHGDLESNKNFDFTGSYRTPDPNSDDLDFLRITTQISVTNWAVYIVTSSGTLTKGSDGTNEHEAIHLTRGLFLEKTDDVPDPNCVSPGPGENITWTICWENTSETTFEDVTLIDFLPAGVTYDPVISLIPIVIDPNYDFEANTYTFFLGTIEPNDTGCVSLTVEVNEGAEPGLTLNNVVEAWAGQTRVGTTSEQTPVCCWDTVDPGIIFVDQSAKGGDSGVDWFNAYTGPDGLRKALARATQSDCAEFFTIYVAGGTYTPGSSETDTFALPEGTAVYGGFRPGGSPFTDRNPDRYQTVLTGTFDPNSPPNDTVVTMLDDPLLDAESLLDGFTITDADMDGISGSDVNFTVENCRITDNQREGLFSENGNVTVEWCTIKNNGRRGIEHQGENYFLTVENSRILANQEFGLRSLDSTPRVRNSVVFRNGEFQDGFPGIRIINPTISPVLYNNTILNNRTSGIAFTDDQDFTGDPNSKDYPDIQNCIIWYNGTDEHGDGGVQVTGFEADSFVWYSCVQDANDVNFNISVEPGFAYTTDPNNLPDPNNPWHLAWDSPCKDAGNPLFETNDLGVFDLDGEERVWNGRIDIGADEVATCDGLLSEDDIWNPLDGNADGLVNYSEFTDWSAAWLSHDPLDPAVVADPNTADPNDLARWCPACNLADTGDSAYIIDLPDLMAFIQDGYWLWTACWKQSQMDRYESMMMAMSGGGEMSIFSSLMELESSLTSTDEASSSGLELSTADYASLVITIDAFMQKVDELREEGRIDKDEFRKTQEVLTEFLLELNELRK